MNAPLRFRFSERDYMHNLMRLNADYITEEEIDIILDEHEWQDLTFIITKTPTGFRTKIIDNNSEQEATLNELNKPSYDFYIRKIEDLSYNRVTTEIEKIRMMLQSKDNVGGTDERNTTTSRYAKVASLRLKQVAQ